MWLGKHLRQTFGRFREVDYGNPQEPLDWVGPDRIVADWCGMCRNVQSLALPSLAVMMSLEAIPVAVRRAQREGAWESCPTNGHNAGRHPQPSIRATPHCPCRATSRGLRRGQAQTANATLPTI